MQFILLKSILVYRFLHYLSSVFMFTLHIDNVESRKLINRFIQYKIITLLFKCARLQLNPWVRCTTVFKYLIYSGSNSMINIYCTFF